MTEVTPDPLVTVTGRDVGTIVTMVPLAEDTGVTTTVVPLPVTVAGIPWVGQAYSVTVTVTVAGLPVP